MKNAFEFQGGRAVIEGVQKNLKLTDRQIRPLLGFNFDGKSLSFSIFSAQKRQENNLCLTIKFKYPDESPVPPGN